MNRTDLKLLLCLVLVATGLSACNDSFKESPIPRPQRISYSCDATNINAILQQTQQAQLNTPLGYVTVVKPQSLTDYIGWGGLLLLQTFEGNYCAFDLACPYCYSHEAGSKKIQRIQIDGLSAHCPLCLSEYGVIFYGSPAPTQGVANEEGDILRQYKAYIGGDGTKLYVTQ